MNPLIPGLGESGKMSSSEPLSKVDFDDSEQQVTDKIMNSFSPEGKVHGNGLLSILEHVLFIYLKKSNRPFVVARSQGTSLAVFPHQTNSIEGAEQKFHTFAEVADAYGKQDLTSSELKAAVAKLLNEFTAPLRQKITENINLLHEAYPPTHHKESMVH
jgi:tyrosyl-tRNA synthetase